MHDRLLYCRILLVSFFLLFFCVHSEASKGTEVEAEGYADISDGKKGEAREMALQDAFRRAVEQAVGVMVESETLVKNFELLNDKVYSRSKGFIKKYTITKEKVEANGFRVSIKATVLAVKLHKALDEIGMIIKKVGKPRVMLLISEQNIMSDKPSAWWTDGSSGVGVAENTLLSKLMDKGFNVVDRQSVMRAVKDDPSLSKGITNITNDIALKLASEGEAEVVVIGQAVAKAGAGMMGTSIKSCQAVFSARALNADTGEPLASVTTNGSQPHVDPVVGGAEAVKKASLEMSEKLASQIIAKWKKKAGGEHKVRLVVRGISFDKVKGLKELFKSKLDYIEEIYDRGFRDGMLKLDLETTEAAKEVAEDISELKYKGGTMEVTSITSNIIEITLRQK
ncbi:MAG: hypothetical protein EPN22_05990 [Nitrospirae bacterium]|nr:MAG: hypothetical protein EPN22_05990 [Nitrospirota bacterium]